MNATLGGIIYAPKPKRSLTDQEQEAINLLRKSGVSVLINYEIKVKGECMIAPKGDAYSVCDNWIEDVGRKEDK